MDSIELREVKITGKGTKPENYKIQDLVTGDMLENVRSVHVEIGMGDVPRVTIEQLHTDGPELDLQAMAAIKDGRDRFEDSRGGLWLNAANLASMIREGGKVSHNGKMPIVVHNFSEELLREWEDSKSAQREGQNKET